MLWEVINPSDAYTFVCDDFSVAALAIVLLGEGRYGLKEVGGERAVPLFLFGGHDEWLTERFGMTVEQGLAAHRSTIAEALASVMTGTPAEREAYEIALKHIPEEGRAAFRLEVHEQRRSSLNNIGKRAWALANALKVPA